MDWVKIACRCPRSLAELVEALMLDEGAVAITLLDAEDDAIFEPTPGTTPLWDGIVIEGLFSSETVPRSNTRP